LRPQVSIYFSRIAGIDLPREKRIEIGLTYIYGIGRTSAKKILEMAQINPDIRVKDLPFTSEHLLLTLSLLMLRVFANNHNTALALDHLAFFAHGLHGRSYFHTVNLH